jgi:hypothetical protein
MSLYTAAIENVEYCLEEIADGNIVMPEPFMNLKLLVWRAQQEYLNWSADGAPETVLENLRALIVQAAWMSKQADGGGQIGPDMSMEEAPPPQPMGAAMPMMPGMPMPGGMPPLPTAPPMMPPPQAAFSPQAMSLVPGVG